MISIEVLRDWAGVPADDDSRDGVLLQLSLGITALIERETGLILRSPPTAYEQVLDGSPFPRRGLTQAEPYVQYLRLRVAPVTRLAGTCTVAADGTAVVGTGTRFTTQASADPAGVLRIAGETVLIASIEDDTHLTLAEAHVAGATAAAITAPLISIESRDEIGSAWTALDPRDFEFETTKIFAAAQSMPVGPRTMRVRYLVGYEEDAGPGDVVLVILRGVKTLFAERPRRSKSVQIEGALTINWADFKDSAGAFKAEVDALSAWPPPGVTNGIFLEGASSLWP